MSAAPPVPGASGYLNTCGHGLPSAAVTARIAAHLHLESEIGPEPARQAVAADLDRVRADAARLVNADADRLGLGATTTTLWTAIVARLGLSGGRVLVAPHEWGTNIETLEAMARAAGGSVEVLPEIDLANPDLGRWQERIGPDVRGIFVPMVTSIAGHRYPVEAIGALRRPERCAYVVDAAQALGQTEVDVTRIGADVVVATTRKWLRGPRQTALFWLAAERPALGGLAPSQIEQPDFHIGLRLGQGVAIADALERGVAEIEARIAAVSSVLRSRAGALGLAVEGSAGATTGAVAAHVPAGRATAVRDALLTAGIAGRWPPASDEPCAPALPDGVERLRLSAHVYTPDETVERALEAIASAL